MAELRRAKLTDKDYKRMNISDFDRDKIRSDLSRSSDEKKSQDDKAGRSSEKEADEAQNADKGEWVLP